jgi:hypothetical protein
MPNPGLAYKIAELLSSSGPSSWPSAAAPANDVSIYGALRDIWDAVRNGTGGAEPATNRGIMDYLGASPAFCSPHFGFRVTKTEDVATATSDDLFTLTGKVAITLWTCEVTNALNASPTDYKIELTTLAGVLIAAGNIASSIVGHMFTLNGDAGDTSLSTSTSAVSVGGVGDTNGKYGPIVVGIAGGSDIIKATRTAGASGDAIIHTVFYWPLEAGASLVAAA